MAHDHSHSHGATDFGRAFAIGIALNLAFVIVEFGFGAAVGSLALVADAGHNLSDVAGLGLAWAGAWLTRRRPSERYSYGLRKSSVLAALANAVLLLVAIGGIIWEALHRFGAPEAPNGRVVMFVAGFGILVNAITAWLFVSGRKGDINVRGAFLHMAADAAVSLGVVVTGAVMLLTGLAWIDPVVSLVIAGVILVGTWGLLRESVGLALDGVPAGIDTGELREALLAHPGCLGVHDLHVWAMSTTEPALTAHLVVDPTGWPEGCLRVIAKEMHDRFGIEHTTIQIETDQPDGQCGCDDDAPNV
jgi:cobalt-zinc-cadmium efflux system protein